MNTLIKKSLHIIFGACIGYLLCLGAVTYASDWTDNYEFAFDMQVSMEELYKNEAKAIDEHNLCLRNDISTHPVICKIFIRNMGINEK